MSTHHPLATLTLQGTEQEQRKEQAFARLAFTSLAGARSAEGRTVQQRHRLITDTFCPAGTVQSHVNSFPLLGREGGTPAHHRKIHIRDGFLLHFTPLLPYVLLREASTVHFLMQNVPITPGLIDNALFPSGFTVKYLSRCVRDSQLRQGLLVLNADQTDGMGIFLPKQLIIWISDEKWQVSRTDE